VWNILLDNVAWIKDYVTHNNINTYISADFVVQLDNYHEIPAFVELCSQLGIQRIAFQKMWNWGTWDYEIFKEKNIFDTSHPKYPELVKMFKQANREIPF
jgi:MoaA/NifB/PqqE/SkfB family radical SAM enzyme